MFRPTHLLVSRSKQIPVHLVSSRKGFFLVTESEWYQNRKPAFEMHPHRGLFCHGIAVLGYSLQPLAIKASEATPVPEYD
ncbi:hypothetical protein IQ238_13435 [Pleurocapsales cyanobacterium LEGE 06147]|nr:hypothetical protein [Pleurocapsales cyanobacterium LEGE 06147]